MTDEPLLIEVRVVDAFYFHVTLPCGQGWPGMRHTDDVRIVIDRAMDHFKSCDICAPRVTA